MLLLAGLANQPHQALRQSGQLEAIGTENVTPNLDKALNRAQSLLEFSPEPRRAA